MNILNNIMTTTYREADLITSSDRNIMYTEKFAIGDHVVYPYHGVGLITGEEEQHIGGVTAYFYIITIQTDSMVVRVPKSKAHDLIRHLSSEEEVNHALNVLKELGTISKEIWNKRAQMYGEKINSGRLDLIAEVLRNLHRTFVEKTSMSSSEKEIYDVAMQRLVCEYSLVIGKPKNEVTQLITSILHYYQGQ